MTASRAESAEVPNRSSAPVRSSVLNLISSGRTLVLNLALSVAVVAFAVMFLRTARSPAITIRPIAVPEALSKRGYTPEVFAERVAAEMARIDRGASTLMKRGRVLGREDRPDFQLPGQPLSFRMLTRYIQELVGIAEPTVGADVTEQDGTYIAQVRVAGGPYDGSIEVARSPASDPTDALVSKVAEAGLRACEPYIMADYLTTAEEARCRMAPPCDFSPSLALYDVMLTKAPPADRRWALLGQSYVLNLLKRYDASSASAERAAVLDPRFAPAYINWGSALDSLGLWKEAIKKYKKAIALDPADASAYSNWGDVLLSQGRNEEAIKKFKKAVDLSPGYAVPYFNWACALQSLGRGDEAIEKYAKSIEIDPGDGGAYENWGVILHSRRRMDEAIEKYEKATARDPHYAPAYNKWGNALRSLGRNGEAIEKYKKATECDPNFGLAYRNWAAVLESLRCAEEAGMIRALANEADHK